MPLALYLLSFALPFGLSMRQLRWALPFLAVLALAPIARVVTSTGKIALSTRLVVLMPAFFAICLACHVEYAPTGAVPRLLVLIALCYASLCLANHGRHIRAITRRLSDELQRQILPDGLESRFSRADHHGSLGRGGDLCFNKIY